MNKPINATKLFQYAEWVSFILQQIEAEPERWFSFRELARSYRLKTGKKTSRQYLQRQLKKLPKNIKVNRKEQLWLKFYEQKVSSTSEKKKIKKDSMYSPNCNPSNHRKQPESNLVHSSHKWRFSIKYQGPQPIQGAEKIRTFGRYKTAAQAYFFYKGLTIISFKHKLNVWIHRPEGRLTKDQKIAARTRAFLALTEFARERGLTLNEDMAALLSSHHVVEHDALNEALKPVVGPRAKEIKEIVGTHICLSSHKGKLEHEGVEGSITAYGVAKNLEYLCTDFPGHFSTLAQANVEFRHNLISHLGIMQDIGRTLKEIREGIKEIKKLNE